MVCHWLTWVPRQHWKVTVSDYLVVIGVRHAWWFWIPWWWVRTPSLQPCRTRSRVGQDICSVGTKTSVGSSVQTQLKSCARWRPGRRTLWFCRLHGGGGIQVSKLPVSNSVVQDLCQQRMSRQSLQRSWVQSSGIHRDKVWCHHQVSSGARTTAGGFLILTVVPATGQGNYDALIRYPFNPFMNSFWTMFCAVGRFGASRRKPWRYITLGGSFSHASCLGLSIGIYW